MMGVIKYQKKENMAFEILPNGVKRAEMLPGMVEGVHTYKCQVKAGETVELEVFGDITQLIYITSGECYITTRDKAFMVNRAITVHSEYGSGKKCPSCSDGMWSICS